MFVSNLRDLSFVLAVTSGSQAATSLAFERSPANCSLREHHIVSVKPYHTPERVRKGGGSLRLRGAQLFVEAEPGLTAEWLQLTLERDIARLRQAPDTADCVLAVEGVHVRVGSGGNGFYVWIAAGERQKAEEILRRAKLLLRASDPRHSSGRGTGSPETKVAAGAFFPSAGR